MPEEAEEAGTHHTCGGSRRRGRTEDQCHRPRAKDELSGFLIGRSNSTLDSSETQDYYLSFVTVGQQRHNAYLLSGYIKNGPKVVGIKALFDSGADVMIINQRVMDKYQLPIPVPSTSEMQMEAQIRLEQ